ncbi:hypothetical protein GLOIN_2v1765169 [Rhizophagus irregularis DAOM 181602=DAOM 197198]|uniref:Uncharacterized protein n=1 Tax=Rhizophagus irregularis (strain DAOM 181602 / DAOM 197198 / MUCL 43194) TaxID=747089 RepID=A0A2P4QQB3_RHIID|nr:hypothetical protein GLOIN_2v1765169 [Rhizophagus irregularis DAOM 181602=DAOM 197198]POG79826.1 hypothetical protein GLOIN_2v1765169 [Rhizophagus irregularis DAOM 181602=DAOM 197198]|eukprot:XP_025186692.1 hypothetical protein GLOIN_2v1765169 [Rhizophagus irregularis DAOM 181602=DAOM 197198]
MSAIGKWNPYNYGGQWNAVYLMVGMSVGHRDTFCNVNAFWNKIELNGQLQDQLQTAEIEAVSSLISVSKKTFATTIRNVHSAIENVNDTLTITGTENPKKRPEEATSPVITPPPNFHGRSPPPSYKSGDNSFDAETSTEASPSPDEIDTFFQGPPNVVKDASRKRRTSTIFNTDDAIVDVGQTTCDESESPVKAEKAEKSKTIFSWGHVVDKLKISDKSDHDWLANGYNISKDFRDFQMSTDKLEYLKCSEQIWQDALPKPLIPSELPVSAQLNIMQYSRFLTDKKLLREKWCHNWTKWEHSMTEEEKNIFECVQLVSRNFFLNIPSDSIDNIMDKDTFVHKYCHSMLEEIFNTSNLKLVWANGESDSSKKRRKSDNHKHGRKPDFRVLFNKESEIIFGEIKPPRATNVIVNKALIKLAEFMKGSLDSLHKQFGYSQASETFRIIINDELNRPTTPTGLSYHRDSNTSSHLVHIPVLNIPPPVTLTEFY